MSPVPTRWADLAPEGRVRDALDRADGPLAYMSAESGGTVDEKRNWSNRFADACARLLAPVVRDAMQELGAPGDLEVYPAPEGTGERLVLLGEGSRKRIDVAVVHRLGGLRIDLSLKGLNFRDLQGGQYDKNLTGRTYELEDELRQVRRLQPSAFVFALYWLPLHATSDKTSGESSFARTVVHLRARLQRGAAGAVRSPDRLDGAGVVLYAPYDIPLESGQIVRRGVARCSDVAVDPPRRGRPRVDTTLSLAELVLQWVHLYLEAIGAARPEWAQPEAP